MWQISNPLVNGASQGNYFRTKSQKLAVRKKMLTKTALAAKVANFFSNGFWFWLDERSNNLTTDRQTDIQTISLTPYTGVCGFFLSVKFATSLLASLAGG